MPLQRLSQLHVGKVDGKHEFMESGQNADLFFDAFLVPDTIDIADFIKGDKYIVRGFRGTGKTSLLRYLAKQLRDRGADGQFVLFKSGLSEAQRTEISRQAGIIWEELDSSKMEMSQDFKDAWKWFFHRKMGEILVSKSALSTAAEEKHAYLQMLGLIDKPWFDRVVGGFPKLDAAKVKIKGRIAPFEAWLEGKIKGDAKSGTILFADIVQTLDALLCKLELANQIYIYVDELEVFFQSPEQYRRDLRLIRDLLFAVDHFSNFAAAHHIDLRFCVAVRSEILDALGAEGQEVSRLAHDRGVQIAWHYANRGLHHPLFEMIRKKIWSSEIRAKVRKTDDPISHYFPASINKIPLDVFILDQSFYKPRDIIWRLSLAQQQFPTRPRFSDDTFIATDIDYSAKLWEEVVYELSAVYSTEEISIIEGLFLGKSVFVDLADVESRLLAASTMNPIAQKLSNRRGARLILQDLYRLGAIGNAFRVGTRSEDVRHRWMFRGDTTPLVEKRMELHPAVIRRLSAVRPRRPRHRSRS
jgi:hypothetical protein